MGREADSATCVLVVNALWVKQIVATHLLVFQNQFHSILAWSWIEPHWSRQSDWSSSDDDIMWRRPFPATAPTNQRQLGLMPPADRKWEQRVQEARSGHGALFSPMSLAKDGLMPFICTMENERAVRIKDSPKKHPLSDMSSVAHEVYRVSH